MMPGPKHLLVRLGKCVTRRIAVVTNNWNKLMNCIKMIFNKKFFLAVIAGGVFVSNAVAIQNFGCDDPSNDRIVPELALCSTHVYNIGGVQNPTDSSAREGMKDVIALKTTVIAQQMNKQYEFLEMMVEQMRIQLEKAILLNKFQLAGAANSEDKDKGGTSGSSSSSTKRVAENTGRYLEEANSCSSVYGKQERFDCIKQNLELVKSVTNDGTTPSSEAKKQLKSDCEILQATVTNHTANCMNECSSSMTTRGMANCIRAMDSLLNELYEQISNANRPSYFMPNPYSNSSSGA